jgi:hypothetical protein
MDTMKSSVHLHLGGAAASAAALFYGLIACGGAAEVTDDEGATLGEATLAVDADVFVVPFEQGARAVHIGVPLASGASGASLTLLGGGGGHAGIELRVLPSPGESGLIASTWAGDVVCAALPAHVGSTITIDVRDFVQGTFDIKVNGAWTSCADPLTAGR